VILDTKTGFSEEGLQGAEAVACYTGHLQEIERAARDTLPPGALFSVGNLSDGTGHGYAHVWVQGEHLAAACGALARRFPRLVVGPLTQSSYDSLAEQRAEQLQEAQRLVKVAQVREQVERVCASENILYEICIATHQIGQRIVMIVYVQGEYRDRIRSWLFAALGDAGNHSLEVQPLTREQYFDLHKRKNGQQPLARATQAL